MEIAPCWRLDFVAQLLDFVEVRRRDECGDDRVRHLGLRAGGRASAIGQNEKKATPISLSYIITRVAPHCVNTLRILHAAYDATNTTRPLVNTHSVR